MDMIIYMNQNKKEKKLQFLNKSKFYHKTT